MSYIDRNWYTGRFGLCYDKDELCITQNMITITGTYIFFYRYRHHLHLHHQLHHHHHHIIVITIISSLFLLNMKSMMMTLLSSSLSLQLLQKKANDKKQRNIMKINIIILQILRNLPCIHCFTNLFSPKKQIYLNTFATDGVLLLIGCQ